MESEKSHYYLVANTRAKAQCDILLYHDKRDFERLKESAIALLKTYDFHPRLIESISEAIKNAYLFDAYIDDNVEGVTHKELDKHYERIVRTHYVVSRLNNEKNALKAAYYFAKWWEEFMIWGRTRSNSPIRATVAYFRIATYLFLHQWKKLGFLTSVIAAPFLVLAGIKGHNRRDRKVAEKYYSRYFTVLLILNQKCICY